MTTLTDDELLAWLERSATPIGEQLAARFRELLALQEWQPDDGKLCEWHLSIEAQAYLLRASFKGPIVEADEWRPLAQYVREVAKRCTRPLPHPPKDG